MYSNRQLVLCVLLGFAAIRAGAAQQSCINGIRVEGTVTDPTSALVPGAQVQVENGLTTINRCRRTFSFCRVSLSHPRVSRFRRTVLPRPRSRVPKKPGDHRTSHGPFATGQRRDGCAGRSRRYGSRCGSWRGNDEPQYGTSTTATRRRSRRSDPAAPDSRVERRRRSRVPRFSSLMDSKTGAPCRPRTRLLRFV